MKYNRMCVYIKNVAAQIKDLDSKSECRTESSEALLQKLYNLGNLALSLNILGFSRMVSVVQSTEHRIGVGLVYCVVPFKLLYCSKSDVRFK